MNNQGRISNLSASSTQQGNGTGAEPDKSYFSPPPVVSFSKGGGAIKGMGEKFAANPVTGTGCMSVPTATSPGRSGFGPQLSLFYDSGTGNGIFGMIIAQTSEGYCRHFDCGSYQYQVYHNRPIPCRAYDCGHDPRIWADFENRIVSSELEKLFSNPVVEERNSP